MAANISLSYAEIERVSNKLDSAVEETLVPRMTEAKTEVDNLLASALVLVEASPALQQQYDRFTTELTKATDAITQYAEQFREIKRQVENMDKEVADKVRSA
ncbi:MULTISPECIES: M3 family metallopeptidase [Streptomyces]|uniref:M3 family metallopeptidase n=2 Tax=Streptomyces TaxID=1883 RepID=A0A7X6D1J7_9ACTN|nr:MULTISPECIES: M3 family metallopeptidase [Streptomyces]NJP67431.1 M3 family metallopeptidase [Streptomyces spiramenti]NJQ06527.1 M3 family metallopeptidase [Streptomyces lonarensis]